jgi:cytochrome c oxidase subunit II
VSGRRVGIAAGALALVLALAGCGQNRQNTLKPASEASREITTLWWVILAVSGVVTAVVVMLIVVAILRRRTESRDPRSERRARGLILGGGLVAPLVVLPVIFGLALDTLPATSAPRDERAALTIDVVGKQWFWAARYEGSNAVTANEIHIPVGQTVRVRVSTADVIHSFWVPELNRKIDTIPRRQNAVLLHADHAGIYRGQCAEYCGLQHANMSFVVYADPPARFRAWLANMAKPRRAPTTASRRRGERVFQTEGCSGCHAIRGTPADGTLGPDLTHLASRATIAALTLPNTKGYLGGWILDPQHAKPGNKMPGFDIPGPELQALLDYLTSLR